MSAPSLEQERNAALLAWYEDNGRRLPWRGTSDPYPVLVSEMMAQQTQALRAAEAFVGFMERFPTIEDLAAAALKDVLEAWSVLGYNSRAERLHRTARHIAASRWPRDVAGLEELPGVGPYTARAVAAFAFGADVAAVDTNVKRVLSRWHGAPLDGVALEQAATADLGEDAAAWNQAVMDLGAVLCRPRRPRCDLCPVEPWCAGPDVYQAPRAQPRFEGSMRQLRGAIVRALVHGPATLDELASSTRSPRASVGAALDRLIGDGLVVDDGTRFRVPD